MTSVPSDTSMDPGSSDTIPGTEGEESPIKLDVKKGSLSEPAGFFVRFAAVMIDGIIVSIVSTPVTLPIGLVIGVAGAGDPETLRGTIGATAALSYLVYLAVMWVYFGWFYKNKGATPGKLIFQLKVHHVESGRYIGYWHAFGRETLGKFISTIVLFIGYIIAIFHPDKRALHDLIFKTRVVRSATR
jgi:uncharacterized RDD family membrane protein YckC